MKVVGGLAAALRHGGHHRGRVHAAGQEGAVGHVGHHLPLDRVGEALGQLARQLVVAGAVERSPGRLAVARSRAAARPRSTISTTRPGQLLHAVEQRSRRGHEPAGEEVVERHAVHLGRTRPAASRAPTSEASATRRPSLHQ